MADINANNREFIPSAGTLLRTFVTDEYFPRVTRDLRGSTRRGYRAIWNNYIEPKLGHLRVRDIRTFDIQRAIDAVVRENADLKRATSARVKSFLSGIFGEAIRCGLRKDDQNPVESVKVRGVKGRAKGETFAYSLTQIRSILNVLPLLPKAVIATASFAGLREGELRGLEWPDYAGDSLGVSRSIWRSVVNRPKTRASAQAVPVIRQLVEILKAYRLSMGNPTTGVMFHSGGGEPMDLNKLGQKIIRPAVQALRLDWYRWHGFRRGIASNLYELGANDKVVQRILRHT